MMTFSNAPRFELLSDGTIRARAGVQTNCGGIAAIRVRMTPSALRELACRVSTEADGGEEQHGSWLPGTAVPAAYREDIFRGAAAAFTQRTPGVGLCFELIEALVHPVDANPRKFELAGRTAVEGWLDLQAQGSPPLP